MSALTSLHAASWPPSPNRRGQIDSLRSSQQTQVCRRKNVSVHKVLKFTKAEWDTGFPFRPKKFSNQYPANFRKSPKIAGFQRGFFRLTIALWAFSPLERNLIRFAHRGKPEFLSLLPRNVHSTGGKKRQHSRSVKTYPSGMGYRVPISPQNVQQPVSG